MLRTRLLDDPIEKLITSDKKCETEKYENKLQNPLTL